MIDLILKSEGWVVINIGHPRTGNKYIVYDTFSSYRKDAIKKFVEGSGNDWKFWRTKFNFRVVKASQMINTK